MIRRNALVVVGAALAGLLLVSAVMLSLGRRERIAEPDSASYGPSGTRLLAETLGQLGYRIRREGSDRFSLRGDEVAIGFIVYEPWPEVRASSARETDPKAAFAESLRRHFRKGGSALLATVPYDFQEASRHAWDGPAGVEAALPDEILGAREVLNVSVGSQPAVDDYALPFNLGEVQSILWQYDEDSFLAGMSRIESGYCLYVSDALGATNRFLDRADNAALFVSAIRALARPGSTLVFLEAAHRPPQDPALTEILGPWASAAWAQLGVLFAIVLYTLGRRFGVPSEERPPERGAKELVDAVASLYHRARATDLALEALVERADRDIRRALRLSRDAPATMVYDALPNSLSEALRRARALAQERSRSGDALKAAVALERGLARFLGSR